MVTDSAINIREKLNLVTLLHGHFNFAVFFGKLHLFTKFCNN